MQKNSPPQRPLRKISADSHTIGGIIHLFGSEIDSAVYLQEFRYSFCPLCSEIKQKKKYPYSYRSSLHIIHKYGGGEYPRDIIQVQVKP